MEGPMNLQKFLMANTSSTAFTHTGLKGGKYWIPDDKLESTLILFMNLE